MAKSRNQFVCQSCGAVHAKWSGKCESCGEWNTLQEETAQASSPQSAKLRGGRKITFEGLSGEEKSTPRRSTHMGELNRVLGGGLVDGSAILLGGDPGIGKSTLILQLAAQLGKHEKVIYITGEESVEQIRLRARRLGVESANVDVAATTNVRDILSTLEGLNSPSTILVDSIQTMYVDTIESAPGTVSQVRAGAAELITLCKKKSLTLILVGHVTKDGMIAGPKVLEHMVDTVLYFEGDRGHQFRILRAVKNRFGPANEIGVFEMEARGLIEVSNPSALFLSHRDVPVTGSVVFAGVEGTRPVLVEIQTLVAPSPLGTPRRTVVGWDSARLSMILAVLETRCGMQFSGQDVYLNVAGGLRIHEPAADLAVAAGLISSVLHVPVPSDTVIFGEIGLSGEVRQSPQSDLRLRESEKLGFKSVWMSEKKTDKKADGTKKSAELLVKNLPEVYTLLQYMRDLKQHSKPSRAVA